MNYFNYMCALTEYVPRTTWWHDFNEAEKDGIIDIKNTFNKFFEIAKQDYKKLTELVMITNWKLWQYHELGNEELSMFYQKLYEEADVYACNHLKGDELIYFFRTVD